jgi:hypothetical protein
MDDSGCRRDLTSLEDHPEEFNASLQACGFVLAKETAAPGMFGATKLHMRVKTVF